MDNSLQTINDAIGSLETSAAMPSGNANEIIATPDGAAGIAALRLLVEADIPALSESKITNLTSDLESINANLAMLNAQMVPQDTPAQAHKVISAYDDTTGAFTLVQLVFTDIAGTAGVGQIPMLPESQITNLVSDLASINSNLATLNAAVVPANTPAQANKFVNAYNSATGAFTLTQPAFTDVSGIASTGQIPNLPESQIVNLVSDLAAINSNLSTLNAKVVPVNTPAQATKFLSAYSNATGAFTFAQPAFTDLSGSIAATQLIAPTASTFGGVKSLAAVASKFLTSIGTDGVPVAAQPAFSDLSGSITGAQIPSGAVTWDELGSAVGALTLSNANFGTTFNVTSAINWTWANTTAATSGTSQSSPILNIAGTYWTSSASAVDKWTIQNIVGNGTNGTSVLTIAHVAGSTGIASVSVPAGSAAALGYGLMFTGTTVGMIASGTNLLGILAQNDVHFRLYTGATPYTELVGSSATDSGFNGGSTLSAMVNNNAVRLSGNILAVATNCICLGNASDLNATAGTQVGITMGSGVTTGAHRLTFKPTSGNATFIGMQIVPIINQTGTASGSYTAILANVIETALLGASNKLLDLQAGVTGGTSKFTINNSGRVTVHNGIATAGIGSTSVYGATSQKSESAADANVLTYTPPAVAGTYRISFAMDVSVATSATLGWTATWTNSNGNAQAPANLALSTTGTAAPALTVTAAANGTYYGRAVINVNNSGTAIVVKLTFSGTSFTAKVSASIEQII